jgi:hypothetical protein
VKGETKGEHQDRQQSSIGFTLTLSLCHQQCATVTYSDCANYTTTCSALSHTTLKRESQLRRHVLTLGNLILLLAQVFRLKYDQKKMRHLDEGRIVQSPHIRIRMMRANTFEY